ncbi:uncharacterized protein LOC130549732 [Triplophysa rosa]|uniref:Uncharacterized protein n=1 Tax=Triplophysa rosa TaxID=992332 RepID=A0A9W7T282_TRIRA|nr:uncharacterized protein LOC130549732 [Triplophysa rosa]KAI7789643.1 hypothetical protein IRJ41_024969 [Triplophysa rosa]
MRDIIPKNKIKGVDICGDKSYTYIICSDLGCYMRTSDLQKGSDLTIFKLHPSCQNGDHYSADRLGRFYIIKGESCRTVTDLSTDADAVVKDIHPNFQGGDHYLHYMGSGSGSVSLFVSMCLFELFMPIIIFQGRGTFRRDYMFDNHREINLHPSCSNGLYYWGLGLGCCFLKPVSEWGVEYYRGTDLEKGDGQVFSVHPDVVSFLPGGLSITQGPALGRWENIKTICNDSDTPVSWQEKIIKKVGYNKEKMKEITHNWKFGASATIESGELAKLIAKVQFSLSAEYGGSHVGTEKESWDEATEVEEQLSFKLKPHKSLYLWQYRLGVGGESVLFGRDLIISDEPNPPTEAPLQTHEKTSMKYISSPLHDMPQMCHDEPIYTKLIRWCSDYMH